MDRRVIEALRRLPERNRFMKGLFSWVGFRQTGIDYERDSRAYGVTKWKYWRLWNFALDGITSSSTLPLHIWTYAGLVISGFAFAYAAFLMINTLINGVDVPGYASLMVVVLLFGGINLLTLGIIGEYLGRIYTEVKARPLYLVRAAGLRPVRTTYFNSLLFPAIAAVRLIKAVVGLSDREDDAMPPLGLNRLLTALFASERHLIGRVPLPAGVSLLMLAQKPEAR